MCSRSTHPRAGYPTYAIPSTIALVLVLFAGNSAAQSAQGSVAAAASSLADGLVASSAQGTQAISQQQSPRVSQLVGVRQEDTFASLASEQTNNFTSSRATDSVSVTALADKYLLETLNGEECGEPIFHSLNESGHEIPASSPDKEFSMTLKKARKGQVKAQYDLGFLYDYGIYVNQCKSKALHWYRRAAKQGHEAAGKRIVDFGCAAALSTVPEFRSVRSVVMSLSGDLVNFLGSVCGYGTDRLGSFATIE